MLGWSGVGSDRSKGVELATASTTGHGAEGGGLQVSGRLELDSGVAWDELFAGKTQH